jgi:hypothetical protein
MAKIAAYPLEDGSEAWAVESIDTDRDGIVEKAIFTGPNAERQARGFAWAEYGLTEPVRRCA